MIVGRMINDRQVLVYNERNLPVTAGFLSVTGGCARMNVFTLPRFRGQGAGDLAARLLLMAGMKAGLTRYIALSVPESDGFYERYGFAPCGGAQLEAAAEDIIFPRKCGG